MEQDRPDHRDEARHREETGEQLGGWPGEPASREQRPDPGAEGDAEQQGIGQVRRGTGRRRCLRRHAFGGHRGSIPERWCRSKEIPKRPKPRLSPVIDPTSRRDQGKRSIVEAAAPNLAETAVMTSPSSTRRASTETGEAAGEGDSKPVVSSAPPSFSGFTTSE